MFHIANMWEAASVDAGSDFSKIVHRPRRGRRGTTILSVESAFSIDLLGVLL